MSQRVTVAVPDGLFERLQPVNHHFNHSVICQEALDMVVTREELTLQTTDDTLVDRLQVEKRILLSKVRQEGFELGIRSSSKLTYKEFRHFERVAPLATCLDDEVLDYLWSFLDQKGYPQDTRLHDPDFAYLLKVDPASRVVFAQGWLDGALSVWQTIKAQVESV